jgi:hypothetical protein
MSEAKIADSDRLSEAIDQWVSRRKNASLGLLAKLSGVPYPTVRRVAQREFRPTLQNALQIASVVLPADQVIDVIGESYGESVRLMRDLFSVKKDAKLVEPSISEEALSSKEDYWVYIQATKGEGIAVEAIKERFGREGLRSLDKLLALHLVEQRGELVKTPETQMALVSGKTILAAVSHLTELFEMDRLEEDGTLAWTNAEGLNELGISKAHKVMIKATQELREILADRANQGDKMLGLGLISTRLSYGEPQ